MKKSISTHKIIISLTVFIIISLLSIYTSQSISNDNLENIFIKQIIYYFIGLGVLLFSYKNKEIIIKYDYLLYIGFNFLLLILLFLGISINGSKCWLIIGPFSFQPSEFMKLSLIISISKLLSKNYKKKKLKDEFILLIKVFIIVLIPAILTFLEPDTGVVIIYFIITIGIILYRGINKKWIFIFLIIFIFTGSTILFLYFIKKDFLLNILGDNIYYRLDRILNWSKGNGYQLENSIISIGSGGLYGFGFNNLPLYFPEASTDFIFTSYATSFGFIGSIILIIFLIIFDSTILNIIKNKIKLQDKYILIGIFVMILYQQFQNISMTIGLLPIMGITLPFISYGGSSLLSYMFITGILLRISKDNEKYFN